METDVEREWNRGSCCEVGNQVCKLQIGSKMFRDDFEHTLKEKRKAVVVNIVEMII